ncbi:TetR/AcrR family transcriptional regulator [Aeromicrobium sp. CTD01-1L150]|uniref:TetR/AcrR family transcriptional regulator n=1 Tax=Aeromicrobium sp. CTD01-1L150 TaxID=3341830 RepID=UPI0035C1F015
MSRPVASGPASPRPRAEHLGPQARRPLVLDAALVVWSQNGHRGTTMSAVAEQARVSKPVVYECFPTKDAMLLALLDREEKRLFRAAVSSLPREPTDPRQDLTGAFTAFFVAVQEHPLSWRVIFDAQHSVPTEVGARYRAARAQVVEQVAVLLQLAGLRTATMDDPEALLAAEHCVGLAELGAGKLLADDEPVHWSPQTLSRVLTDLVLDGIG